MCKLHFTKHNAWLKLPDSVPLNWAFKSLDVFELYEEEWLL